MPGVRALLDRYADDPALRRPANAEHRLVAVAAGLATLGDPLLRTANLGRAFVARVREVGPPAVRKPLGLGARLREVFAA